MEVVSGCVVDGEITMCDGRKLRRSDGRAADVEVDLVAGRREGWLGDRVLGLSRRGDGIALGYSSG
jgi:hypothetical protein